MSKQKPLPLKCITFYELNHFGQYKKTQFVTDAIKKLNSRNKTLSIATYGYPTVYRNIPHNTEAGVLYKKVFL